MRTELCNLLYFKEDQKDQYIIFGASVPQNMPLYEFMNHVHKSTHSLQELATKLTTYYHDLEQRTDYPIALRLTSALARIQSDEFLVEAVMPLGEIYGYMWEPLAKQTPNFTTQQVRDLGSLIEKRLNQFTH
jgi:hypothetical protein